MSKFARNMSILIVAIMLGVALASWGPPPDVGNHSRPPCRSQLPPSVEPTAEPEPTEPEPTDGGF